MKITLARRYSFGAIHTLPNELDAKGQPLLHGHDYQLWIHLCGDSLEETGWLYARDRMDQIVKTEVLDRFNGGWINHKLTPASGENLAVEITKYLRESPLGAAFRGIELHETRKNTFTVFLK